ncbi:hypothetical protein ACSDR0_23470 [Streptosporangium sp. G11]|uniref:hypothetical protein n=1 Tax=Streptosporangium sp. G11 TaxID=3436926 RepID=UPI003EBBD866
MPTPDTRVDDFMQAPLAAAMFVLADRLGLSVERLAEPATATALASTAQRDLNPWTGQAAANRVRVLALAQPLRDLVTAVVTDPRNAWWSASLDRRAQLLLTGQDDPQRDPLDLRAPQGPNDAWETYAQKPLRSIVTSTELPVARDEPIRSGAHAEISSGISDWAPVYPVRQVRLSVSTAARIYEVDSAADWHRLVQRYGNVATHPGLDESLRDAADIDNGPAPTWSSVANDYDAVHLTFAGLLTGLYVPHTTEEFSTTLWAWNWESTHWLRPVFIRGTSLDELPQAPEDPGYHRPL